MTSKVLEVGGWFLLTTLELVALFLALGFLVELLRAWIPEDKIRGWFGRRGATSYLAGAILGAVTPFCSYSTILVLAGLLRSGVPFGPTITFLFASPLLDPVVLGVLVFVIGFKGAVIYAATTFMASIGMGVLWTRLGLEADVKWAALPGDTLEADGSSKEIGKQAWVRTWRFFLPVLPYLLLGTAIGAVIYGFVPAGWMASIAGPEQPFAIPLAAVLGVPLYVNAETFFPVAQALLDKGAGVGAVIALVITAMGVSIPELALLTGLFRLRLVVVLVASIFVAATGSGAVFALMAS